MGLSRLEQIARMPEPERHAFLRSMPTDEKVALERNDWSVIARPEQLAPPGGWRHWWSIGGRGSGKTLGGANYLHRRVQRGEMELGALVGPTKDAVREIQIEGKSGVCNTWRGQGRVVYEVTKRKVTWPNGAAAFIYTDEEPERLRGPEPDTAWCDEPGTWRHDVITRNNLNLALRAQDPRVIWTTTPRNIPIVKQAMATIHQQARDCAEHGGYWERNPLVVEGKVWRTEPAVVGTLMSTYDNLHNLDPMWAADIIAEYEGTRLGRQELHAELLDDVGTIFRRGWYKIADDPVFAGRDATVRYWDLAATPVGEGTPNPDWTVGVKLTRYLDDDVDVIEDVRRTRATAGQVEQLIRQTADVDGPDVRIGIEQEPGSSGKAQIAHYKTLLAGYVVNPGDPGIYRPTGPKQARATYHAGRAEQGKVHLRRGDWNLVWLDEHEEFDNGDHDDQVDATSGALEMLRSSTGRAEFITQPIVETRLPQVHGGRYARR